MKKKLILKKETVAMLDNGMKAVRGGGGSEQCESYVYDDRGLCLATNTCPHTYTCPPGESALCVTNADFCVSKNDGYVCVSEISGISDKCFEASGCGC